MVLRIISLFLCLLLLLKLNKDDLIISSSSMWIGCFILIYIVYPQFNTFINDNQIAIISFMGISFYSIGLVLGKRMSNTHVKIGHLSLASRLNQNIESERVSRIFFLLVMMTIILLVTAYGMQLVSMIIRGSVSPLQVLRGQVGVKYNRRMVTIVSWFFSAISCALVLVVISGRNGFKDHEVRKILSIVLFAIIIMLFTIARRNLIYPVLAIVFYYLNKLDKKKKILFITIVAGIAILVMVIMDHIRTWGLGNLSHIGDYYRANGASLEHLFNSTDFGGAYYYFSQLLGHGRIVVSPLVYLKFLFVFIPRAIWPGKPESLTVQINNVMNSDFKDAGRSTGMGIFGEAFAILGYAGFVIYPLIWGLITSSLDYKKQSLSRNKSCPTYLDALYYVYSTMFIMEVHRGNSADPFMIMLYTHIIPMLFLAVAKIRLTDHT